MMAKVLGLKRLVDNNNTSFLPASITHNPGILPQAFSLSLALPSVTLMMFSATIFPVSSLG